MLILVTYFGASLDLQILRNLLRQSRFLSLGYQLFEIQFHTDWILVVMNYMSSTKEDI